MKKVGIITFHHAKHSYGAFLQAFATLHFLLRKGFEAELINYDNKWEQKEIHFTKFFITNIKLVANWMVRMFLFGSIFDPCRSKKRLNTMYGRVSKKVNKNSIDKLDYDLVIAGSDQIWNPNITNGIDSNYFLAPFKCQRKIAYASSIGSYSFNQDEENIIQKYLNEFELIGVREKYACETLANLTNTKVENVCDPTFLFNKEEWIEYSKKYTKNTMPKKYILTYFVGGNFDFYWDRIKDIVKKVGLPVYNIQSHRKKYKHVDGIITNILPFELISLIYNSELVLTDSFHGTAFSIYLEKDFVAVINKNNPIRVLDLLSKLNLEDRVDNGANSVLEPIDYKVVSQKVNSMRSESGKWLLNAIDEKENYKNE